MSQTPNVLILGDSISLHVMPFPAERFAGEFTVVHHEGNTVLARTISDAIRGEAGTRS